MRFNRLVVRAVVQRVSRASVRVGEETAREIGAGLLVLYALVMFAGALRDGARRRAAEGAS